jgi:hypothetical protein
MYIGKELDDCFANLHMTINNEIRTVKQEIKETDERVGVLESHAELVNDLIKTLNEETVPNLEDKLNTRTTGFSSLTRQTGRFLSKPTKFSFVP